MESSRCRRPIGRRGRFSSLPASLSRLCACLRMASDVDSGDSETVKQSRPAGAHKSLLAAPAQETPPPLQSWCPNCTTFLEEVGRPSFNVLQNYGSSKGVLDRVRDHRLFTLATEDCQRYIGTDRCQPAPQLNRSVRPQGPLQEMTTMATQC
jgi:hypothetical protein